MYVHCSRHLHLSMLLRLPDILLPNILHMEHHIPSLRQLLPFHLRNSDMRSHLLCLLFIILGFHMIFKN